MITRMAGGGGVDEMVAINALVDWVVLVTWITLSMQMEPSC